MSKLIVALHRVPPDIACSVRRMRRIIEEITPDIARTGARIAVEHGLGHGLGPGGEAEGRPGGGPWLLRGTLNLPAATLRAGMSLCQGRIYGAAEGWEVPGAPFPDGSYALVRDDARFLEAVSDPAASRSLWYYLDEELFVVSNSQRAVTLYAGRFELEPRVVPWLLASGTLGPGLSYNRHLGVLPPASSVTLDKAAWTLRRTEGGFRFAALPRPREAQRAALADALEATLAAFGPEDARHTVVALSGGADSRAIAALLVRLRPGVRWRSFTGGPAEALEVEGTDAWVAARVAARIGTEHRFIANRVSPEPIETVIDRFVLASEGRVDHLGGYLDGLAQFRTLAAAGAETIIRGDTCFGGPVFAPADSERAMRQTISLLLCGELASLRPHLDGPGLAGHALPAALVRLPGESLLTWRDRLYLLFRAPCVLSALTETKSAFVEVANPLLSRRAIELASALPDALRLDKALFREVVDGLVPGLPFAGEIGGRKMADVLRQPEVRRLLAASLAEPSARAAFGARLTERVRGEIDLRRHARARAGRVISRLPLWPIGRRPAAGPMGPESGEPEVHPLRLAFRMHMGRVMIDRLKADAALFAAADGQARRRA
jgi:hypothetical protein